MQFLNDNKKQGPFKHRNLLKNIEFAKTFFIKFQLKFLFLNRITLSVVQFTHIFVILFVTYKLKQLERQKEVLSTENEALKQRER